MYILLLVISEFWGGVDFSVLWGLFFVLMVDIFNIVKDVICVF